MTAATPTARANAPRTSGMTRVTTAGLWANRSRFTLTGLAVLLSVAFLTAMLILTTTISGTASDDIREANAGIDLVVTGAELGESAESGGPRGADTLSSVVPLGTETSLTALDGVDDAVGIVNGYARALDADGIPVDTGVITYTGQNWVDGELGTHTLVDGTAPTGADQVVLETRTADELGLAIGDSVEVLTSTGTLDVEVAGTADYATSSSDPDAAIVFFDDAVAADVLAATGLERIVVDGTADAAAVAAAVGTDPLGNPLTVTTGADYAQGLVDDVESRTSFQTTFLLFFAGVALVAGTTIIYNTFVIAVAQRTRELALLRTIGASKRQVLGSVMIEAAVIGVLASAVGAAFGVVTVFGLISLFEAIGLSFLAGSPVITAPSLVAGFVVGVLATLGSAYAPARKAASIAPIAALRDAVNDTSAASIVRNGFAVALLLCGIVLGIWGVVAGDWLPATAGIVSAFVGIIVGGPGVTSIFSRSVDGVIGRFRDKDSTIVGRLARMNAIRNPKRSASTAFALTLGVALISFFTVMASSLGASTSSDVSDALASDLVVESLSTGPIGEATIPADLDTTIAGIDGVTSISSLRVTTALTDGTGLVVGSVDADAVTTTYDLGVTDGSLAALEDGQIAVSQTYLDTLETPLAVGDTVELAFPAAGIVETEIGAIVANDLPGLAPSFIFDTATLDGIVGPGLDDTIYVTTDGSEAAFAAIEEAVGSAGGATLFTADAYADSLGSFIDTFTNFVYAMLAVAVVIAVVGIANTTVMAVNERVKEIGMLRAVGMTSKQIRSMIRNEAAMLSVQGSVVGLAFGIAAAYVAFSALGGDEGIIISVPVVTMAWIALAGAVSGVLAAAWPAWKASRLPPLEAMS